MSAFGRCLTLLFVSLCLFSELCILLPIPSPEKRSITSLCLTVGLYTCPQQDLQVRVSLVKSLVRQRVSMTKVTFIANGRKKNKHIKLWFYSFSNQNSFYHKFPDEPHLDGQDTNAAGEKVSQVFRRRALFSLSFLDGFTMHFISITTLALASGYSQVTEGGKPNIYQPSPLASHLSLCLRAGWPQPHVTLAFNVRLMLNQLELPLSYTTSIIISMWPVLLLYKYPPWR